MCEKKHGHLLDNGGKNLEWEQKEVMSYGHCDTPRDFSQESLLVA